MASTTTGDGVRWSNRTGATLVADIERHRLAESVVQLRPLVNRVPSTLDNSEGYRSLLLGEIELAEVLHNVPSYPNAGVEDPEQEGRIQVAIQNLNHAETHASHDVDKEESALLLARCHMARNDMARALETFKRVKHTAFNDARSRVFTAQGLACHARALAKLGNDQDTQLKLLQSMESMAFDILPRLQQGSPFSPPQLQDTTSYKDLFWGLLQLAHLRFAAQKHDELVTGLRNILQHSVSHALRDHTMELLADTLLYCGAESYTPPNSLPSNRTRSIAFGHSPESPEEEVLLLLLLRMQRYAEGGTCPVEQVSDVVRLLNRIVPLLQQNGDTTTLIKTVEQALVVTDGDISVWKIFIAVTSAHPSQAYNAKRAIEGCRSLLSILEREKKVLIAQEKQMADRETTVAVNVESALKTACETADYLTPRQCLEADQTEMCSTLAHLLTATATDFGEALTLCSSVLDNPASSSFVLVSAAQTAASACICQARLAGDLADRHALLDRAIVFAERAKQDSEGFALEASYLHALALVELGRTGEALSELRSASEASKSTPPVQWLQFLSMLLAATERYEESLAVCHSALEQRPEDYQLLKLLIGVVEARDGPEAALSTLQQLFPVFANIISPSLMNGMSTRDSHLGSGTSRSSTVHNSMTLPTPGDMFEGESTFSIEASSAYTGTLPTSSVISADLAMVPDSVLAQAWIEAARLFTCLGKFDDAQSCIDSAKSVSRNNVEVEHAAGALLLARGDVTGACDALEHALSIVPTHVDSLLRLGQALHRKGANDLAEQRLVQARRLAPLDPKIWHELGRVVADRGDTDKAAEFLFHALALESAVSVLPFSSLPASVTTGP